MMNTTIKASDLEVSRPQFTPDEAWIESFAKQCTDALRLKAKRYAGWRARGVGKAGAHVDDYYELVQDALTDTLLGVVAWDPAAAPLEDHVLDGIKSRTRHDRKHALRYRRSESIPRRAARRASRSKSHSASVDRLLATGVIKLAIHASMSGSALFDGLVSAVVEGVPVPVPGHS